MRPAQVVVGAIAGLTATVPMTVVMQTLHRQLPDPDQYALPPEQITLDLAQRAGLQRTSAWQAIDALAWGLHAAYGAGAAVVYAGLTRDRGLPGWLSGPVYGTVVWAGSYFGWLPVVGLRGRGDEQSPRRNALMLVAHLVWGSALGRIMTQVQPRADA